MLALVLSVAANVYLAAALAVPSAPHDAGAPPNRDEPASPSTSPAAPLTSAPPLVAALTCTQIRAEIVAGEQKIETLLPAAQRYARLPRTPAHEDAVRPYLEDMFEKLRAGGTCKPTQTPLRVECHAPICRVEGPCSAGDVGLFIQTDLGRMGLLAFRTYDGDRGVFIEVGDDARPQPPGATVMSRIVGELWTSLALGGCALPEDPGGQTLELRLRLETSPRRIAVTPTGSLAATEIGTCVTELMEAAIASAILPDDLTTLPFEVVPVVPLGPWR